MKGKIIFIIVAAFCILIGLYPFVYYLIFEQEFALLPNKPDFIRSSIGWKVGFYLHIIFGGLALLTGWMQFIPTIRVTKPKLHRLIGFIYVVSVFISSISGVGIGVFATGGIIAALGFNCLGFIWFYTTYKAYATIIAGDVAKHRMWMIYSFSACFTGVTLRIWMPLLALLFDDFVTGYRIVAWLSWLPNILVASLIIKRNNMKEYQKSTGLNETGLRKNKNIQTMKTLVTATLIFLSCFSVKAQNLPEFNDKPAYVDVKTKELKELEKSQYNTMAKAKGLNKAEGGFFLNGIASPVRIAKQEEIKFVVKVTPGTDPTSIFDLVQFEIRKDQRVFITTKAKATSTSTSFEKISYEVKKIKDGYYDLLVKNLGAGEYFFGSSDFMFAFGVE